MYLILKTQANGGNGEDSQAACAVIALNREILDSMLGMMDQAAQLSEKLEKPMTLMCMDWTPVWYADYPTCAAFTQHEEDALDTGEPGWCLLEAYPFPNDPETPSTESWIFPPPPGTPVALSYCEMRVSADDVQWYCGPKYGEVEAYTWAIGREALRQSSLVRGVHP